MDTGADWINQVDDAGSGADGMDSPSQALTRFDSYEQLQQALRPELAAKATRLLRALEPYVDGTFGEVDPRHAAVAVQVIKELGRLYRVYDRPEPDVVGFTEEQVQARIAEAVAVAVEQARVQWERDRAVRGAENRKMILSSLRGEDSGQAS